MLFCQYCCPFLAKAEDWLKQDCTVHAFAGLEQTGEQYGWMLELLTAGIATNLFYFLQSLRKITGSDFWKIQQWWLYFSCKNIV